MTAAQLTFIKKTAAKWGRRYRFSIVEDLEQEGYLAVESGKDPHDAIMNAWKYWQWEDLHQGKHKSPPPVKVGEAHEFELVMESHEGRVIARDFLKKIFAAVGKKARATMTANYTGAHCVWRPEVKAELLRVATEV